MWLEVAALPPFPKKKTERPSVRARRSRGATCLSPSSR